VDPQQLLARLKSGYSSFSRGQLASLVAAFLVVVGVVVGSTYWLNAPSYRVLFSDMDAESASQVVQKLRDQKVSYELADGGRTIRVPDTQIDQLRLDFSSQGLPASGRIGFEIFDHTQFGATEFLEQVNYRRALEGEIARTIATISEVGGARVHIAMAKDSLFGAREQAAKASVVLKLKNANRPLAPSTVQGIEALVAASVEGLRPEHVVVMDSFGRPLSKQESGGDEPLGGAELDRQQRFERDLAARVVGLLEPVVGAQRVRVNVAARLNPDSEDRVEEQFDPETVVRSRAVTQESAAANASSGGAGARANVPGPVPPGANQPVAPSLAAATQPPPALQPVRSTETTNYEVSKVTKHTIRPRGDVARLSVAVIVDDDRVTTRDKAGQPVTKSKPRDPAEIQKIQGLVAAAVGLDTTRGDLLTVENIAFDEMVETPVAEPGFMQRYGGGIKEVSRVTVVLVLGVLAILFIAQPIAKRALAGASGRTDVRVLQPNQLPRSIEEIEGEIEAQLDAANGGRLPDRRMPVLTRRVLSMAQKEPESAARLVRTWLLEERKS
jgi:flagellar M-ring protein FliF